MLDASHLAIRGRPDGTRQELHVSWTELGAAEWTDRLTQGRGQVRGALTADLPRRLVALDEVDPRTLESRRTPGLYLCGEILDAFGPIGGHNFLWAWATGRAAGTGAARAHAEVSP